MLYTYFAFSVYFENGPLAVQATQAAKQTFSQQENNPVVYLEVHLNHDTYN